MKLKGKVAIVTGGGQGIGRAFSMRLAQEGAKVIVADINKVNASHVEEEIKRGGLEAKAVFVDVSNEQSTLDMANETVETYGKIDILVNNAAIFSTIKMKKNGGNYRGRMGCHDECKFKRRLFMLQSCCAGDEKNKIAEGSLIFPQLRSIWDGRIISIMLHRRQAYWDSADLWPEKLASTTLR